MSTFNNENYLKEAISSVLKQTYKNFELIIIDDASIDKTPQILRRIKDKRVRIFRNKKNIGLAKSLNLGLKKAKGELIARCDSDDINIPSRFEKQVRFLDKNRDYILVGSNFDIIDTNGKEIGGVTLPESDKEIRRKIIIRNPILHPAIIYRRKRILGIGGYREFFNGAEDYDLFFRCLKVGKIHNLQENLVRRRWHSDAITRKKHLKIEFIALIVRLVNLFNL